MATFAIVRADGSVDKVDGASEQDVSNKYGAPGNGTIEAWDEGKHGSKLANTFASPDEQYAAWQKVAESEGQFDPEGSANKPAAPAATPAPSAAATASQVLVATNSRDELNALAEKKGVESPESFATKAELADAIVAAISED
jgi:hypothetical protein